MKNVSRSAPTDAVCAYCGWPIHRLEGDWFDELTPPRRFCQARPGARRHEPVQS